MSADLFIERWTQTVDALPAEGKCVLVWVTVGNDDGFVGLAELQRHGPNGVVWDGLGCRIRPNAVTHWMPLPDKPC